MYFIFHMAMSFATRTRGTLADGYVDELLSREGHRALVALLMVLMK